MSYILDALKKADKERELGSVPNIETVHEDLPGRPRVWPWALGALVLVNIGVIYWTQWSPATLTTAVQTPATPLAAGTPATADAIAKPAEPVSTDPAPVATAPYAPTTAPSTQPVADQQAMPASTGADTEPPTQPVAVSDAPPAASPAVAPPPVAMAKPVVPPTIQSTNALMPSAVAPPETAPASVSDVPLLRDLPPEFRQGVPPVTVDVHVWGSKPEQRFVLINMRKYREGERLAEGPVLETILENGVVLSHQGRQFRLARQ